MFKKINPFLPYLMWLFPLLFFTYQFILRLWPGLMMQQIQKQFAIDASHFGMLAALYYYGYAGMQIPVAILLERYGARYILFLFAFICGLAALTFTYTDNWYLACASRFLIGAGSTVGFLGISKVLSEWFSPENYSRMVGFSLSVGLMGAMYGGKPVSILIEQYPWQNVALTLSLVAMFLGVAALCFLRPAHKQTHFSENTFKMGYFKELLCSPIIWLLAIANFLMVGSLEGFADIWGVPFLMTSYHLAKAEAAQLVSFIFVGMIVGGPLLAWISRRLGNYVVISACGVFMAIAFAFLLSEFSYNWYKLAGLFFTIGIMCCYQVIVFATGSDLVRPQLLGVTVAFLNCINMLGGSFFHTIIGHAMDSFWTGQISSGGVKLYALNSYLSALKIIPCSALTGAAIILLLKMITFRRNSRPISV